MSSTITCPKCRSEIEITEVMSAQLREQIRGELENELQPRRRELETLTQKLKQQQGALEEAQRTVNEQVQRQLDTERKKLAQQAKVKAAEELAVEINDRDERLKEMQTRLQQAGERELVWRKKERELEDREQALGRDREEMAKELNQELEKQRGQLVAQATQRAKEELAVEMKDRDQQLNELREKLQKASATELEMRKRERDLLEKAEQLQLEVTRQLDAERDKIRDAARKQADEAHQLKAREKDQLIDGLRGQIDELKRKAEQGSQQIQGEVLELALEDLLRQTFPGDAIEEVAKGIRGADLMQRVRSSSGGDCGTILWETKRTKTWSDGWLPKLRQDQRDTSATVALLVSTALPEGVDHFKHIEGIWVCSWACAMNVATALRVGLLEVGKMRRSMEGQQGKMEQVYNYLAGPQFRNRVSGIAEAFMTMKQDLDAEKRAIQKQWAKREKQIEQALCSTVGMYGDLQGIIGGSLPEIEGMSLLQLEVAS